jgi:endonuclease-3 related protein
MTPLQKQFMAVYGLMLERFGPLSWWPAETPFEVCVGAILTQNTAWTNVEKAIIALKQAEVLNPNAMRDIDPEQLAQLIRPAGYFNLKSKRLKSFIIWLFQNHGGSLENLRAGTLQALRPELLNVCGIGPETADSILLYAAEKPTFVVDAYTRRLFHRLGLLAENAGYDQTRDLFMNNLPPDAQLFNEYHAQIVEQCKQYCRKKPLCNICPLLSRCQFTNTAP